METAVAERQLKGGQWLWTDDTAMALSLLQILDRHGRVDQDALAAAFASTGHRGVQGSGRGRVCSVIGSRDDCPLLFLDVDGPLIPFRARPGWHKPATSGGSASAEALGNPLIDRLDPADGRRLLELGCELVWATTWMAEANEIVAPRIGLPFLPIVDFPDDDAIPAHGLHWKTQFLVDWADGRPFVWLDDEITDTDRQWVRSHHEGVALLHRVDPFTGLTDADFAELRRWLATR